MYLGTYLECLRQSVVRAVVLFHICIRSRADSQMGVLIIIINALMCRTLAPCTCTISTVKWQSVRMPFNGGSAESQQRSSFREIPTIF